MKIAIAQQNYHIGNIAYNVEKILSAIAEAKAQGADLVLFGELAITGYYPYDLLEFESFIQECQEAISTIAQAAQDIAVVLGAPTKNPIAEGKDLFNSAYMLFDGKVQYVQHKTLLPTYDIFDEYRHFEPASDFIVAAYKGKRFALSICEDIWNVGNENPLYTICPLDEIYKQGFDVILNLSASPFNYRHAMQRIKTVRSNVMRYQAPMFYANQVGAQTQIIFDGGSIVMSADGKVFDEMPYFREDMRIYDLEAVEKGGIEREQSKNKIALIHDALILGIQDYFKKVGLKQAIFGLSGGIDSAIVAVLAQRALGAENVRCLLLPSQYSSDHSITDSRKLAENIDIQYDLLKIEDIYKSVEGTMANLFMATKPDTTEENIQARIRGLLLMAMNNKFGHVLLNTSNKSEAAVDYGTLYGDMAGGLAVLGDVYKTEVYELAHYINKDKEVIPMNIIHKAPSAELRPDQKDSDSLPPYDILDAILYSYIEERKSAKEIIAIGYDEALVKRVLRLVNNNEFKRAQFAPILRVSPKAFGTGRRMPIVAKYNA